MNMQIHPKITSTWWAMAFVLKLKPFSSGRQTITMLVCKWDLGFKKIISWSLYYLFKYTHTCIDTCTYIYIYITDPYYYTFFCTGKGPRRGRVREQPSTCDCVCNNQFAYDGQLRWCRVPCQVVDTASSSLHIVNTQKIWAFLSACNQYEDS